MRSPDEIRERWSFLDVHDAHCVLNWRAECQAYDLKRAEKQRESPKPSQRKPKR